MKRWYLKPEAPKDFLEKFPEYHPLILQLLYNRKITNKEQIGDFFNFNYEEDLADPFLMKDMDKAVKRIEKAIKNKERIAVFGDYDVDGVTSTVILAKTLKLFGNEPKEIYIPDRAKEGYGLNLAAIKFLKKQKINLIITVDCGISNIKEIALANQLGMETIVTDHHAVPEKIPPALAVLNPRQKDCPYPFKELAGVGVAYKLAQALICKSEVRSQKSKISNGFEKWLLDLVALGTVADCVPLLGENRILVHYGLIVLNKTRNLGLKKIINASRLANRNNGNGSSCGQSAVGRRESDRLIDVEDISFVIAPRLNVAGRMDHANLTFELLMSESEVEAERIAQKLEKRNQERQKLTVEIVEEVKKRFYKKSGQKIIFESDPRWPVGLVGLVAGKLSDEFSRPALIFSKGKKESVGSGRSIPCFNLIEAVSRCQDLLLEFGGHSQAAGFTLLNENSEDFFKALNFIAERKLREEDLVPTFEIDAEVEPKDMNWEFLDEVSNFAPFGEANPYPLFLMKNLKIKEKRVVGNEGKHLKMWLSCRLEGKEKIFEAIGFNFGEYFYKLKENDSVDVIFELISNHWNGYSSLQLKIVDLKKSKK